MTSFREWRPRAEVGPNARKEGTFVVHLTILHYGQAWVSHVLGMGKPYLTKEEAVALAKAVDPTYA